MFALYKHTLFRAGVTEENDKFVIHTFDKEKAKKYSLEKDLMEDDEVYRKDFLKEDSSLTDYFSICFWVTYPVECHGRVQTEWDVMGRLDTIMGDCIKIYYSGSLDGWTIEEKYSCSKYIPIKDLQGAYLIKNYEKKDGVVQSVKEREDIPLDKFIETYRMYYGMQ